LVEKERMNAMLSNSTEIQVTSSILSKKLPTVISHEVVVSSQLSEELLLSLLRKEILAIRVPKFYLPEHADEVSVRMMEHPGFGYYQNAPAIGRVGMAYFEATVSEEAKEAYYSLAAPSMQQMFDVCAPFPVPISKLHAEMLRMWTPGLQLAAIEDRRMFVGLARVFSNGSEAVPHQDVLRWDAPAGNAIAESVLEQLAANVYLKTTAKGGELELWDFSLTQAEYEQLRAPNSYGLDRSALPAPAMTIRPEVGDMILFHSTNLHAVRPSSDGLRISQSCFVGFRGEKSSLITWS